MTLTDRQIQSALEQLIAMYDDIDLLPYRQYAVLQKKDHQVWFHSFFSDNTPEMTKEEREMSQMIHEFMWTKNSYWKVVHHPFTMYKELFGTLPL